MEINFERTGDPFVDAGGLALKTLMEKFPKKTLIELIEWAAKVYVNNWAGKINSVFLNTPITQSSKKGEEKITATIEMYKEMINNKSNPGICRFCGKESYLSDAGRDKSCLVGSRAFINFHHYHEPGIMICPECAIKYFFLPLSLLQMSNLSLLQTVTKAGEEYWRKKTIEENLNRISRGSSETILKSRYKNPENGIFHLASELITETEYNLKEEYLTLYYFTNFSASVDCEIYKIPNPVFRFLNLVLKYSGRYWNNFVNRHYWIKGGVWNDEEGRWMVKSTLLSEEEIINKGNTIYKKLITGENILNNIYRYTSDNYKKNKEIDSIIAIYYAEEVLKMTSEQIGKIKEVGLRIFNLMQQQNDYKKYMVQLEGATKAFMLRSVLLNMIKKNYVSGNEKTLLGLDEWVNYLFPDGHYWSETRDLLLIFLYEKLHENRLKVDIGDTGEIEEAAEEENNEGI